MNTNTPTTIPAVSVMLDIETYGLAPGSVIKTIGAVKFGIVDGKPTILDRFYRRISGASCTAVGLVIDAETIEWWFQQSEEARKEMTLPGEPVTAVLQSFDFWLGRVDSTNLEIWGNGSTFDNVLLHKAYRACQIPACWTHFQSRCYRTVKNANRDLPIDAYRVRTHHNALDDAESQAMHLMAIWERDAKRQKAVEALRNGLPGFSYLLDIASPYISPGTVEEWKEWMEGARSLLLDTQRKTE